MYFTNIVLLSLYLIEDKALTSHSLFIKNVQMLTFV
ncbi:hypothetical protein VINE108274_21790 [Vibrio neptunius]